MRHLAGDLAEPPRGVEAGKPAANNHDLGEGGHLLYSKRCMPKPGVAPPESTVTTACPLDCPDACTLSVTVRGGRVTKIDGATENHITNGYICAKVRRFPERVYGDDRAALSGDATRRQGQRAVQARDVGRRAGSHRVEDAGGARRRGRGNDPAALLRRIERVPDAGLRRRDPVPPLRHLAAVEDGVRGADRRGQPRSLRQDGIGQLRGLPRREDDHRLGREPGRVGHSPHAVPQAGARERRLHRGDRSARDRRGATGGPAPGGAAGHRSAGGARDSSLSLRGRARRARRSSTRTPTAPRSCARRRASGRSSAPPRSAASAPISCGSWPSGTRRPHPRS